MTNPRPIHPDFRMLLDLKSQEVTDLFCDLRQYILELCPDANELLYHTHALPAVFSVSETSVGIFTVWLFTRGKWKTVEI